MTAPRSLTPASVAAPGSYREIPRPAVTPETLADRLRRLRTAKGWTQETLSEHSGVSRDNISRIERGRHYVLAYTLDALADALDVSMDYLWVGPAGCEPEVAS